MSDVFGELRSVVQGPPSEVAWWRLVRLCERVQPERTDELVPYLDGSLARWPDALRITPHRWLARAQAGEAAPLLAITRHLHLPKHTSRDDWHVERGLRAPFPRQALEGTIAPIHAPAPEAALRWRLDALTDAAGGWPWTHLTAEDVGALTPHVDYTQLTSLRVGWRASTELDGEADLAMTALQNLDPARLTTLALPHIGTSDEALKLLRLRRWPELRALSLGGSSIDPKHAEGWLDLAASFPALELLDLDASFSGDTSDVPELQRLFWLASARPPATLRALDLAETLLYVADEPEGLAESLPTVPWLSQLRALSLLGHPVNASALGWLATQQQLEVLSLGNELCEALPETIAGALGRLSRLRVLSWTLGLTSAAHEVAAFHALPDTLEALRWTHTLDAEAARALGARLTARPLRELTISCGGDALDALIQAPAPQALELLALETDAWEDGDDMRVATLATRTDTLRRVALGTCSEAALRRLATSRVHTVHLLQPPADAEATDDLASSLGLEIWW